MKSLPVLSTGLELGLGTKIAAAGFRRIMVIVRCFDLTALEVDLRGADTRGDIDTVSKPYET